MTGAAVHLSARANDRAFFAPHLAAFDVVGADHVADEADDPQCAGRHKPHSRAAQLKVSGNTAGQEHARKGNEGHSHSEGLAP